MIFEYCSVGGIFSENFQNRKDVQASQLIIFKDKDEYKK